VEVLIAFVIFVVLIFSFVILFGAPYLPTLTKTADDAFELLGLKPGQTLLELGSGDGKMLRFAARKGIKSIGYELNPILVLYTWLTCLKYKGLVKVYCRNYWQITFPACDGIYVFLLDKYMVKLDKKIIADIRKPIKLVSHAFKIPHRNILAEKNALFLYRY
jgi:hypothetical protein